MQDMGFQQRFQLLLDNIEKANHYINIAGIINSDFSIASKDYCVNGKSIGGIFSLNLMEPVIIVGNNDTDMETLKSRLLRAGLNVLPLTYEIER